jgi:hypothetical protein
VAHLHSPNIISSHSVDYKGSADALSGPALYQPTGVSADSLRMSCSKSKQTSSLSADCEGKADVLSGPAGISLQRAGKPAVSARTARAVLMH